MLKKLNGSWKLKTAGNGSATVHGEVDAEVPGSVLDAWIKASIVPDPYFGENEKLVTPLFENSFEYSRAFTVDAEFLSEDRIELVCLGIDTLGEIFVNGKSLGHVNNMHRSWRFNVKEFLVQGENSIRIELSSPNAFTTETYESGAIKYTNTGTMAGSSYLRKAHCQFGWDWGPKLPDAGIWRDIYLEGWNIARLDDVYLTQEHRTDGKVIINA